MGSILSSCEGANGRRVDRIQPISIRDKSFFPIFPKPQEKIQKYIQRYAHRFYKRVLGDEKFNGQYLVAKNGRVFYYKAQGYANYKEKKKLRQDTQMHVASVSKVATALCVMRLVDRKLIKLDSDIRRYLPEIPYSGITVRMLLNHRSGIPYYGYFTYDTWGIKKTLHNHDILALLKKYQFPLYFPPNAKFSYCNTNFALLALIIERVTRKDFPKAMKEWIFEPLHMNDSFILSPRVEVMSLSRSHNSHMVEQRFTYLDAVYGDKNMYTTAHDLLKMDMATYSNTFLSDSIKNQMYKGYSYEHHGINNYALGMRMKEQKGKHSLFFHTGWWHGNTACYSSLRHDTICIIAISNVYNRSTYNMGMLAAKYGNYPNEYSKNPLD
jgi:CubicO group peptidase (beta-lactamase class C family)